MPFARPAAKPVPRRTFGNLVPPNREYSYRSATGAVRRPYGFFGGVDTVPFDAAAKAWSTANATWLADAALLAYEPDPRGREAVYTAARLGSRDVTGGTTLATIAHGADAVLVTFRGTRVLKPGVSPIGVMTDLIADARFGWVEEPGRGRVHGGFRRALDDVWPEVSDRLAALHRERSRPVWFAGHSLGAALATLAAARHRTAHGVYAIASPRVGDREFAKSLAAVPVIRVVHGRDLVTQVPPARWGYEHVGEPRYLTTDGTLRGDAPDGVSLNDHAPLFYGVHLWNLAIA